MLLSIIMKMRLTQTRRLVSIVAASTPSRLLPLRVQVSVAVRVVRNVVSFSCLLRGCGKFSVKTLKTLVLLPTAGIRKLNSEIPNTNRYM